VSRTTVYVKRKPVVLVESDEVLKRLIDEEYTRHGERCAVGLALWMTYSRG
jgi:hypothetical protein